MKVGGRVSPDGSVIYLVRNRWYLVTGLRYGSQMVVLLCPTTTSGNLRAFVHWKFRRRITAIVYGGSFRRHRVYLLYSPVHITPLEPRQKVIM